MKFRIKIKEIYEKKAFYLYLITNEGLILLIANNNKKALANTILNYQKNFSN